MKLKWGIIGVGNIAQRFMRSLEKSTTGELYALASKKKQIRDKYSDVKCYDTYDSLLNDQNVDAVYIALPHKFHAQWSIKALASNKAVLCEKPACLNSSEINLVIDTAIANNTFYMEAIKTKFTPAFKKLIEFIDSGIIGEIKKIEANFCFDIVGTNAIKDSYSLDKDQGGSFYDVGSYLLSFVQSIIMGKVLDIEVDAEVFNGIDYHTIVDMCFENNLKANIESAIDRNKERVATIFGSKGSIKVPYFNRCTSFSIESADINLNYNEPLEVDDFFGQIEEVNNCLKKKQIESKIHSFEMMKKQTMLLEKISELIKEKTHDKY